jgi:branched-chain amino acid aminotransferase
MTPPSAEPLAFLDGRFQPQSTARLSLHDAGFVMGATVTDLCRTFNGRLYRWEDHLDRFQHSCRAISISLPMSTDEICSRALELLEHNRRLIDPADDLALVMFATPGPIGYYLGELGGVGDAAVTFGMHTFPLPFPRYRKLLTDGASLIVPDIRQVPGAVINPHIKQRSRLHWWLADREANRIEPGSIALLLDLDGYVTETAAANVLFVKNGVVLSPPRQHILEGVSLAVVRELCGELAIPFAERPLTLDECLAADEVMLTCTSYCLAGLSRLQGKTVPFPGATLSRLLAAWNRLAGLDIHKQILGTSER